MAQVAAQHATRDLADPRHSARGRAAYRQLVQLISELDAAGAEYTQKYRAVQSQRLAAGLSERLEVDGVVLDLPVDAAQVLGAARATALPPERGVPIEHLWSISSHADRVAALRRQAEEARASQAVADQQRAAVRRDVEESARIGVTGTAVIDRTPAVASRNLIDQRWG